MLQSPNNEIRREERPDKTEDEEVVKELVRKEKKGNPEHSVNSTGGKQVLVTGECCRGTCYLFVDIGGFSQLEFHQASGTGKGGEAV